jgi:hypothetical protein
VELPEDHLYEAYITNIPYLKKGIRQLTDSIPKNVLQRVVIFLPGAMQSAEVTILVT